MMELYTARPISTPIRLYSLGSAVSCTLVQLYKYIVLQFYICKVVQLYSCTVVQFYICKVVQLYSCTAVQLYSCKILKL